MRGLGQRLQTRRHKLSFFAGLGLATAGLFGAAGLFTMQAAATGTDCDNNAMISCGYTTPSDLIAKIKANDSKNGHHDLPTMYANFGLTSTDYAYFVAHAVQVNVHRDGTIWTNDGQKVADSATTWGRLESFHEPNALKRTVGSNTYYGNVPNITFASGVTSLPAYALFDSQGNFEVAMIQSCGNPSIGHHVPTSASCHMLNETPVPGQLNTYSFTASGTTQGNAKIVKYVYDFGDGSPTKVMTDGSKPVTHTYTRAGHWTAKVTEFASVPGNSNLQLTVVTPCTKVITVTIPFGNCVNLSGVIADADKLKATFTATASFGNGETFTSADFDFGDGTKQVGVAPDAGNNKTATVNHTYATAGNYNAFATLHFMVNGTPMTAPTCKALVTPTTVTPECKPGVPEGSPECLPPCQPGSSVPPTADQCQPPHLPNTGAGNTIAITAGVVVVGFLAYRQLLFRKHRAAFVAAEQGTSALPLADPLSPDTPLANTPLARRMRSFRRKRHY
ncbi:MAG TPA: PKD domain-containing protein [Candidatus Saccharimonadales bacterium]|nr:PKD domain-containing protein [Candidatus Saccharimonadales bacterium]